jgi:predicted RNase H-like nuclease
MSTGAVLGVDGCPAGWVGIVLGAAEGPRAVFGPAFADVVAEAGPVCAIGVDMPVGLSADAARRCDAEARARLGRRRSTLFTMPVQAAFDAATYAEANTRNRAATGQGLSRQAWALAARVLEIERWRGTNGSPLFEVHPELSFAMLAGGSPLAAGKKSWAGMVQRRALLLSGGVEVPDDLGWPGTRAGADDVLDAAAVAWSAQRVRDRRAECIPDPPELDGAGRPMAIWV